MKEFFQELGISIGYLLAGFFGAFVFKAKGQFKWYDFVVRLLSGALCANYITPIVLAVIPLLGGFSMGVAFIIGYGGVHVADTVLEFIKDKFKDNGKGSE